MLNKAIALEAGLVAFYEELGAECDYPDVRTMLIGLKDQHRRMVHSLGEKLSEMHVRGEILDGVMASFDPAGC
jgi:hypothetical protein